MRRLFLGLFFLLLVIATTACNSPNPANSQTDIIQLKLGHVCNAEHPYNLAAQHFADLVSERSDGRIEVTIYPSRQLGGDRDMLEMVQNNTLNMGLITTAVFGGFTPLLNAFQLPYLIDSYDVLDLAIPNESYWDILDGLSEVNVKGLAVWEGGMRHFALRIPVNAPKDLQGLKLRVSEAPLLIDFITALGANPTPIAYGEIYNSLQTRVVDGLDMDIPAIYLEKHFEQIKYVSYSGHFPWPTALIMSESTWGALSEADQELVAQAATDTIAFNHQNIREIEAKTVELLEAEGIIFHEIENLTPFYEASQSVVDKYIAMDPRILTYYEEVMAAKEAAGL